MNPTGPFVLKRDVLLIPCADLSEDVRRRMSYEDGDYTLSQQHGRTLAQVIDGKTASLLALFREPRTIVDAVFENSRAHGTDAEEWLDEMLPHLETLIDKRLLVPAGSEEESGVHWQYDSGAEIAGWKIVRCVSLVEDTDIYQLSRGGTAAALKIARRPTGMEEVFENEAAVLRHLEGSGIAPRLLEAGLHDGRPYLIVEWVPGVDAGLAAAQRRHDRTALVTLCASIAGAYAALHARGVLHADVHPRNVLVSEETVTLVDFGYSRFLAAPPRRGRGGIHYLLEPEYFAAEREGRSGYPSETGEQYGLAALLYFLIAGSHYLDFRYQRDEMAGQIENDPPLPFTRRGLPPWPDVEAILHRALSKQPAQRHRSVAEMAALLAAARDRAAAESLAAPVSAEANAFVDRIVRSFERGGEMFESGYAAPPRASIFFGSAGAAVGLLRIAEARSDPRLLALASVWRSRAAALAGSEDAFYKAGTMPRELIGDVTPYHTAAGIHAAEAMIAASRSDGWSHCRALARFVDASRKPCSALDLTLGRSGSLLAAAMLLPGSDGFPEGTALRAFGRDTMRELWAQLDAHPPLEDEAPGTYLGMAHGWAGYLYATLRWCTAASDALPPRLLERLDQYAALAAADGRALHWPVKIDSSPETTLPSWCHGSAGQLFLFTLAHRLLGDARWLGIAEGCAWDNWSQLSPAATLCCGSAGRGYALLNFYKHTGDPVWLSRARQLANHAVSMAPMTTLAGNSLWKGELGVAVFIADLESPENARMPFFE